MQLTNNLMASLFGNTYLASSASCLKQFNTSINSSSTCIMCMHTHTHTHTHNMVKSVLIL